MSVYSGSETPNNGLVCMLDAANIKSYNSAENLLLYSQALTTSPWANLNCNITTGLPAPDGTNTAALVTCNGTSPTLIYQIPTTTTTGTGILTSSVYAKAATSTTFTFNTYYNLDTEVNITFTLTGAGSTDTPASSTIAAVGNGWYRCTIQTPARVNAGTDVPWRIWPTTRPTATAGLGCYFWGAQLNTSPYARPYTLTTTTARAASTTWTDLTGNGYNATLFNTYFVPTDGGGAFETRGISGSYILQSTLNLAATTYTIITATRYAAASPRGRMFNGRNNNWLLGNWNGTTQNYYAEGWVSAVSAGAADTNWRILAGTGQIAADAYSMYINGTNNILNNTGGSAGPNGFVIGMTGYDLSTELSLGRCSFVLAYNRVLTATEVSQVFQAYRGRFGI
jgi:hypothetical protein